MAIRNLLIVTICILLAGCVTSVEQLRKSNLKGNSFQVELAKAYLDFAETEADQYDWFNSAYFARKGLKAVAGETPSPEDLANWSIDGGTVQTLTQAREYLMLALTPEAMAKFPEQAAKTQFMFDCWVEQQEEGWQQSDIARCREQFYISLDWLFDATEKSVAVTPPPAEVAAPKPVAAPEVKITYFRTDSSALNDGTKRTISNIISRLKDVSDYKITLNGYADAVGGDDMNLRLSKKRAMSVKKALTDGGLKADAITVFAFGSAEGRVKTPKNTHAQKNRVVEIVLEVK